MKKIVLTENITKEEIVEATVEEPKEQVIKAVENQKLEASFSHLNGEMVSFKTNANEIKLKYLSSKNIDVNPQLNDDNKVAIYKDVEDGIDLKYELEERRLKESFIINQRNNNYTFNFEAKIGDLEPLYNEARKCLEFKKDNRVVCRMLPPFMFDNKGEESKKCTYEVENNENGLLSIKLVADANWINSEERELPIIIDPTFELETNCFQYHIYQNCNVDSKGMQDEVFVGYKNENGETKFYSFWVDYNLNALSDPFMDKEVYFEIPLNYNIMDENDEIVVIVNGVGIDSYKPSQLIFNNVLRINVSRCINDECEPCGTIRFHVSSDNYISGLAGQFYKPRTLKQGVFKASFQAAESDGTMRAKLIVKPKEESKQYVDYDIGASGITSVNVQTGRYKHTINDLTVSSGLLTVDINHVFDSRNNANKPFGLNWDLSISQYLKKEKNYYGQIIRYVDGEGTEHVFYEKWFYRNGKIKIYVNRDDVTLSENNELVLRNTGEKVEYEIVNDQDYQYVSLGSATNYDFKSKEYKYYMNYKGFKKEVIPGKKNYLQFIYREFSSEYFPDNENVSIVGNDFVSLSPENELRWHRAYLSNVPTRVYFDNGELKAEIFVKDGPNENKRTKTITLEKVPVYENLDEDLYTNHDIENLEYEMIQAKESLKTIDDIINTNSENIVSVLDLMQNKDFDDQAITMQYDSKGNPLTVKYENALNDYNARQKLYLRFTKLETELISARAQKNNIERNVYFLTRSFNSKIKEQKESANDYIIDPEGNIFLFDGYGRMCGIADRREDKIEIIYNDDSNIETIKSNEEQVVFKYNANKKLESMKKSNGDTVRFTYFDNLLLEINNNGRKTTFGYMNGLQVYSDINEEIIVDTQTTNTIKVKKYVEPGDISGTKEFNFFVNRKLVQNDMFVFSDDFKSTKIIDRIFSDEPSEIDVYFDISGNIIKKIDSKYSLYANYYKGKLISFVKAKKVPNIQLEKCEFNLNVNKYSYFNGDDLDFGANKVTAQCLKIDLNDLAEEDEDLKTIIVAISYKKSNETYNFKQSFVGKDNETIVLPFFIRGQISDFTVSVEANVQSSAVLQSYIKDVSIIDIENGILREYDDKDRLWKIKTIEGKTTYLTFDDKLPTHVEFKDWDGVAITTDYEYNNEGKVVYSIDSKGDCENYLYQNGGKMLEKRTFNIKDASLVRSEKVEYDEKTKTHIEKGDIKDADGNYPEVKTLFYPGTNIVKTEIGLDGSKTEYVINPRSKKIIGLIKENNGIKNSISYVYKGDFLTSVKNNGTTINYTYDGRKRIRTIRALGYDSYFILNNYNDDVIVKGMNDKTYTHGSTIETKVYGGVYSATSSYDKYGNLVRLVQKDSANTNSFTSNYSYNSDNLLTKIETVKSGDNAYSESDVISYDAGKRQNLFEKTIVEDENVVETLKKASKYCSDGRISKVDISIDDSPTLSLSYLYSSEKLLSEENINNIYKINFQHDALNRISHQDIKNNNNFTLRHSFSYLQQDGNTLDLIAEDNVRVVTSDNGYLIENHKYKYDVNGRITEIDIDDKKICYEYDATGRLIKERNEILGIENKYTYDTLSNILSKKTFELSTDSLINCDELIYSCDNKHLLVSINGNQVTSDAYGRITSYNGKNLTWNKEGSLKSISLNDGELVEYIYNDKGIRYLKKSSNGVTTRFVLDESNVLREQSENHLIDYLYSSNGLFGFKYKEETYLYEKNILGDIVRIYNSLGNIVGEYSYDAFGNVTIITDIDGIATINPFRYRGYYYDSDTGLYYLNYRYYDPSIGRFISPDDASYINPDNVNGLNIYAYCNNDPVNHVDPTGHLPEWLKWLGIGLAAVGAVLVGAALAALTCGVGTAILATSMAGAVIHGAAVGTLIGAGVGVVAGGIIGGATTGWSFDGIFYGALIGFGGGAIIGSIIGGTVGGIQFTNAANSWASVESNGRIISSKENMIRHFQKHVVEEGHKYLGKNVIQYTKNANMFKNTVGSFKLLESGSLSARGLLAGNKVRVIVEAITELLLSFC